MSEDQKLHRRHGHLSPKLHEEEQSRDSTGENCESRTPGEDYSECRTPLSEDHKIPTVRSCPPTPQKQALPATSRKRKLGFFETSGLEEVESFFMYNFLELSSKKKADKRRCSSV
ncbi:hypothetical protein SAY87_028651 [Trapa incisa]|uniref:Cyclin-dependent protein kinase inhibitor SMR1 n=1 Tax=Trapa incisa TaxID=236973 RepID=A0AAN7L344_9MYRT|nr:hypothetical protein SAY87_028651 [Trapa incisa]